MQARSIKEEVKERCGKIALEGNSESCCASTECCGGSELISAVQMAKNIGYDAKELEVVPESSILGVGCGAPVNFADIKQGEVVVDIGSGGGIDVFLSAKSKILEK
jgi:arsenite methyltransferase